MSDYYSEDCYAEEEDEDKFNLREWMDEFNRIRKLNKSMYEYPAGWGDLVTQDDCITGQSHTEILSLSEVALEASNPTLPYKLWFDEAGKTRDTGHHAMRVKFYSVDLHRWIPIIMTDDEKTGKRVYIKLANVKEPSHFGKVKKFLIKNYDLVYGWWIGRYSAEQLVSILKKQLKDNKRQ